MTWWRTRPGDPRTIEESGTPCLHKENMRPEIHYVANADAGAIAVTSSTTPVPGSNGVFGPDNPFYGPSTLPFQAPPFDKIQDSDYQPAIEAGMAQQLAEIRAIADSP